jgi:hypothetical protein
MIQAQKIIRLQYQRAVDLEQTFFLVPDSPPPLAGREHRRENISGSLYPAALKA